MRLHWPASARLPVGVTPTLCRLDVSDWELAASPDVITCGVCGTLQTRPAGLPGAERPRPGGMTPKGAWQRPAATLALCTRHRGLCAYRVGDPDRCDYCHAGWAAIQRWPEFTTRADHLAEHATADARRASRPPRKGRDD